MNETQFIHTLHMLVHEWRQRALDAYLQYEDAHEADPYREEYRLKSNHYKYVADDLAAKINKYLDVTT